MVSKMSTLMNMELVHALNPLYAFPIVAVILCAFIVYAFGFKSPVQPPSFDAIDEEKKSTKKRKTKDTSKVKVVQNGKQNGSTFKSQASVSAKKKELEKPVIADKPSVEKSPNEKKLAKKSKSLNEKKASQDKNKESFSLEDAGEDGWVQLISKKGRKNRKKDEATNIQKQTFIPKPAQNLQDNKSDEIILSEEIPKVDVEISVPEKKLFSKQEVNETVPNVETCQEKIVIIKDSEAVIINKEKVAFEENMTKNDKINDETIPKSKKKKKKSPEVDINSVKISELSTEQVISNISAPSNPTNNSLSTTEVSETSNGNKEELQSKEAKTSNVVFDELAGLYPEPKEQRKKKRVRRDH